MIRSSVIPIVDRWLRLAALLVVPLLVVGVLAGPAGATWSIVAVDEETGDVGVAIASCSAVASLADVDQVVAPVVLLPGIGAAVLQGTIDPAAIEKMQILLSDNRNPTEVIDIILAEDDDDLRPVRQYGVVTLDNGQPNLGVYSGPLLDKNAAALGGAFGSVAQGVRTADRSVVPATLNAFDGARREGLALDESLVRGLVAGAEAGGDADCGDQTALFAQLAVLSPSEDSGQPPSNLLTVTIDEGDGQNPVGLLAEAFEQAERGWIDAGKRPPTFIPKTAVLLVGLLMAAAAVIVIRRGMRMG